jgi:hypothetical protein
MNGAHAGKIPDEGQFATPVLVFQNYKWNNMQRNMLAPVRLLDNELYYVDDPVTNHSRRFYRAVPQ